MKLKIKNDYILNEIGEQSFKKTEKGEIYEVNMINRTKKMDFSAFKGLCDESEGGASDGVSFEKWDDEKVKAGIDEYWTEMTDRCKSPQNWKKKPVFYGAGIPGTFFTDDVVGFNPNKIDPEYSVIHRIEKERFIDGIHTPMLYIGQKKSAFPMHGEDHYYWGMSYNHGGAPKVWYVVERSFWKDIINLANKSIKRKKNCDHLLMHKMSMITPNAMDAAGIKYSIVWIFLLYLKNHTNQK